MPLPSEAVSIEELLAEESFVRRVARSLVGADPATEDDVVQETWRRALESAPRDRGRVRGWLAAIVRSVAAGSRREQARRQRREARAARPESLPATDEIVERLLVRRAIVDAVVAMDEPYRTALLLRFYENKPPRDIARDLGVPVATVRTRIHRATVRLRQTLDADRGSSGAWLPGVAGLLAAPALGGSAKAWSAAAGAPTISATTSSVRWFGMGLLAAVKWKAGIAASLLVLVAAFVATWFVASRGPSPSPSSNGPAPGSAMASRETESDSLPAFEATRDSASSASESENGAEVELRALLVHAVRADRGTPVPGVTVTLRDPSPESSAVERVGVTAEDGSVRFEALDAEVVRVTTDRYTSDTHRVESSGLTEVRIEIPGGLDVRGRILDLNGRPVEAASVWLTSFAVQREGSFVATSDANGRFALSCLRGIHSLGARASGHAPSMLHTVNELRAARDGVREVELVLGGPGGGLSGRVVSEAGEPVGRALVTIGPSHDAVLRERAPDGSWLQRPQALRLRSDVDGRFAADSLAPGLHTIQVAAEGFAARLESDVRIEAGEVSELEIQLGSGAALEGIVTDQFGDPYEGIEVSVEQVIPDARFLDFWLGLRTDSASDGTFRIESLPVGDVLFKARASNQAQVEHRVHLEAGDPVTWNPVVPRPIYEIRGRLVDTRERPVRVMWVRVVDGRAAYSDDDGRFRIEVDEDREYEIRLHPTLSNEATRPGVALRFVPRVFPGDEVVIVVPAEDLELGEIRARIVDGSDDAVMDAELFAWNEADGLTIPVTTRPEAGGRVVLTELPPGRYHVSVNAPGRPGMHLDPFTLAPGEDLDLGDLRFEGVGRLLVSLDRGDLAAGASPAIGFGKEDDPYWRTMVVVEPVGSGTTHQTPPLEPGRYCLYIAGRGVAAECHAFEILADRDVELELRLEPAMSRELTIVDRRATDERWFQIDIRDRSGLLVYRSHGSCRQDPESKEWIYATTLALRNDTYAVTIRANGETTEASWSVSESAPRTKRIDLR